MNEFHRRIKLKVYFHDTRKQADLSDEEYRFKRKSNKHWVPTKTNRHIHWSNKKDINEQPTQTKKGLYNSLTKKELGKKKALGQLKRRDDIIITSVNKGGATVIHHFIQYIKEAERQWNNTENYRPVS